MDSKAYTEILDAHRDRLYSTALYVLRDPEDAEDAVQEAFLRLWRSGASVDPDRMAAWLNRVVHNLCVDQTRRRGSQRRHLGFPDEQALDRLPDPRSAPGGPTPEQAALLEAMATLSEETRSIMILHYFQGMKLTEIADALDMNVNSLKVRVHRARRALKLILAPAAASCAARQETG